jgi:hypothetical protein
MKLTKNEKLLIIMSREYKISIWSVGDWTLINSMRAYHNKYAQYYLVDINEDLIMEEFDVSAILCTDDGK